MHISSETINRLVATSAAFMFVLVLARAILTYDPYYDSVAYHLPFAARLAGLCPESCYQMGTYLEQVYDGFPKLMNLLQGLVWRLTGTPQTSDLVNFSALCLFCVFLRSMFGVPLAWAFLALIAVPSIQINATSSYIDLSVNLAIAAAILLTMRMAMEPHLVSPVSLLAALACLAFAANSKQQMCIVAPIVWTGMAAVVARTFFVEGVVAGFRRDEPRHLLYLAAVFVAGGLLLSASMFINIIYFANPFYPHRVELPLGFALPGPIPLRLVDTLAPVWFDVPGPLRWIASVMEISAHDRRTVPWTFDMGYCADAMSFAGCARAPETGFRMGGYFAPYVLALAAFVVLGAAARGHLRRGVLLTLAAATIFVALLPRSHELRYYMFWMIVLVSLALITVFAGERREDDPQHATHRSVLGLIVLIMLASVLALTKGRYVNPSGPSLAEVLRQKGISEAAATIPDGATACIDPAWQPFSSLFSAPYHDGRSYRVLDGDIAPCDMTIRPRPQ